MLQKEKNFEGIYNPPHYYILAIKVKIICPYLLLFFLFHLPNINKANYQEKEVNNQLSDTVNTKTTGAPSIQNETPQKDLSDIFHPSAFSKFSQGLFFRDKQWRYDTTQLHSLLPGQLPLYARYLNQYDDDSHLLKQIRPALHSAA